MLCSTRLSAGEKSWAEKTENRRSTGMLNLVVLNPVLISFCQAVEL